MRKLKLQVHISIDGFIAGPNGEIDWIFTGGSQQPIIDLADTCDTILLGRKMAQGFITHWENTLDQLAESRERALAERMVNMRKIVFSRAGTSITGRNAEVASEDLLTTVTGLKQQEGKDLLVYGGATFVSSLIQHNLIDEYNLFVKPTALGSGMPIFKERRKLKLVKSINHDDLTVQNVYVRD